MMKYGYTLEHVVLDNEMIRRLTSAPDAPPLFTAEDVEAHLQQGYQTAMKMEKLIPLEELAAAGPLREKDVIRLGIDVCRALLFLQRNHTVHGRISPGCVFRSGSGGFHLGFCEGPEERPGNGRKYTAPEVTAGEAPGAAADIYSTGTVILGLLEDSVSPGAYSRLREIAGKACCPEKAMRYFSAEALRADLEALLAEPEEKRACFPENTGPQGAVLIRSTGEKRILNGGLFYAGRSSGCEIAFHANPQHNKISRYHA